MLFHSNSMDFLVIDDTKLLIVGLTIVVQLDMNDNNIKMFIDNSNIKGDNFTAIHFEYNGIKTYIDLDDKEKCNILINFIINRTKWNIYEMNNVEEENNMKLTPIRLIAREDTNEVILKGE